MDVNEITERSRREFAALELRISALAVRVDAECAFLSYFTSKVCRAQSGEDKIDRETFIPRIENAAYYLYPYFNKSEIKDPNIIQDICDCLDKLVFTRHFLIGEFDPNNPSSQIAAHSRLHSEMVRGSAYSQQTKSEIIGLLKPFDSYFSSRVGISPSRALQLLEAIDSAGTLAFDEMGVKIRSLLSDKSKNKILKPDLSELEANALFLEQVNLIPYSVAIGIADLSRNGKEFTETEWNGLRGLIGFTEDYRKTISSQAYVQIKPLYFTSDRKCLFADYSSLYDSLFLAYEEVIKNDSDFSNKTYLPSKTKWLEKSVANHLKRVFPKNCVFENVLYPDPNHPRGEAEMDSVVVWGPFLLLVEVKGTQFRFSSQFGELGHLKNDLKKSIYDAFSQTKRFLTYYENSEQPILRERVTQKKIQLDKNRIRKCFKVCVTLHHLHGLTTQLSALKSISLFREGDYPWAVSLADFDTITKFSETPDIFLHFIQRRCSIHSQIQKIFADEIDLFCAYLANRLEQSLFDKQIKESDGAPTLLSFTGFSEDIDRWMVVDATGVGEKPEIKLQVPDEIRGVLSNLRAYDDDGGRWIAFSLLDLSVDGIVRLAHAIKSMRDATMSDVQMPRISFKDRDILVVVIGIKDQDIETVKKQLIYRCSVEKYRTKAEHVAGLMINQNGNKSFLETAIWAEGAWEFNSEMEEVIKSEPIPKILPNSKLPGRNDPCVCGSGLKFKKCCLGRFRR